MEPTSDRPLTLGEILAKALAAAPLADREAEAIVAAAGDLAKARSHSEHDWTAWRERAGLSASAAKQVSEVHRLALSVADLTALGGVTGALRWAAKVHLPDEGEVLRIALPLSPGKEVTSYVWPSSGGCHVGHMDLTTNDHSHDLVTREPNTDEHGVWKMVWRFLGHRLPSLEFVLMTEDDLDTADFVRALEERRHAIMRGNPSHVH